jgi:chemotaxis protein MotA
VDIATIVGLVAGIGVICGAILMCGGVGMFVDIPSVVVVLGGTFAVTLMKFPSVMSLAL